jgi:hypothetical protein
MSSHLQDDEVDPIGVELRRTAGELAALRESVAAIGSEVGELARRAGVLARAELRESFAVARPGSLCGAGAGVFGLIGLGFADLTLMFLLAVFLPLWLAAFIVTALMLGTAAWLGTRARAMFTDFQIVPTRTIASIEEDLRWAREQLKPNSR